MNVRRSPAEVLPEEPFYWFLPVLFGLSFFVFVEPSPYDLFIVVFCGALIFSRYPYWDFKVVLYALLVVMFLSLRVVSIPVAADFTGSLRYFTIGAYLSLTSVILAAFIGRYGPYVLQRMMVGLYLATLITFLFAVLAKVGVLPFEDVVFKHGGTRVRGFFKDPNVLGPALIPVVLYALHETWHRFSLRHFAMFLGAFALVLATISRGAMLTLVGALGLFALIMIYRDGFHLQRSLNKIIWILLVVFMSLGAGAMYMSVTGQLDVLSQRMEMKDYDVDRFQVHRRLIADIAKKPFGAGPGETDPHVKTYRLEGSDASHNTYLRVAFESGWVGFLMFAMMMLSTAIVGIRQVMRRRVEMPYVAILLPSFAASMVSGLTIDTLHWRHLWIVMALIWGYEAYYRLREQ